MTRYGTNPVYGLYPDFQYMEADCLFYLPFNGKLPYETNFDVDLIAWQPAQTIKAILPATNTGAVIGRPGRWVKGLQTATGNNPTNLCTNPSFETGIAGIVAIGSINSQTHEYSKYGVYSLKCVTNNAAPNEGYSTSTGLAGMAVVAATAYSASVYLRGSGTVRLYINWYTAAGAFIASSAIVNITLTADWTKYVNINQISPALSAFAAIFVDTQIQQTATIYTDAMQFENRAYHTPYADGSLGQGHSWTGAAHASTTNRTVTSLGYTVNMPQAANCQWTIMFWVTPDLQPDETTVYNIIMMWRFDANNYLAVYFDPANNRIYDAWVVGGVSRGSYNWLNLTRGTNYHIAITYDYITNRCNFYAQGVYRGGFNPTAYWASQNNELGPGNISGGANPLCGVIDDICILDIALTEAQIAEIYNSSTPLGYCERDEQICQELT